MKKMILILVALTLISCVEEDCIPETWKFGKLDHCVDDTKRCLYVGGDCFYWIEKTSGKWEEVSFTCYL